MHPCFAQPVHCPASEQFCRSAASTWGHGRRRGTTLEPRLQFGHRLYESNVCVWVLGCGRISNLKCWEGFFGAGIGWAFAQTGAFLNGALSKKTSYIVTMILDPIFLCSLQLTSFRVFKTISRCHNSKDAPSALLFPCVFVFLLCPAVFSLRRTDHHHEIITNIICIIINLLLVKKWTNCLALIVGKQLIVWCR